MFIEIESDSIKINWKTSSNVVRLGNGEIN